MKKILLLMMFLLLFPSMVLAKDTCNNDDIKIEEIKVEEKEGYTEELTPVSIDDNKINLNIEMYNVGESITYKIKIKNNSNNDYYFKKDSFNLNTDYIEYSLLNDSEVIKSNEEKEIELKITYKKQIPEDEFNENNMMSITLSDTPLSNPSTKRTISLILLVIFITIIVITINRNKKLNKVLIGILICSIPLSIKALCTVNLEINANITINEKEAIFLPGQEVNVKMKELAGDDTSTSSSPYNPPYYFQDENIVAVKYSEIEPIESEKEEKNIVSAIDSPYPIYMWYEEGVIYWWSEVKHPKLNEDSSWMFNRMTNLNDLAGLRNFDVSSTTNIYSLFFYDSSITSIEDLRNWDTRNVTNMGFLFCLCYNLSSVDALKDWDVSKVESLDSFLMQDSNITSLEPLKNWDTKNVTTLFQSFQGIGINDLKGLESWNTSRLENLISTFSKCQNLVSLEALKSWDTSRVIYMNQTFSSSGIVKLDGLESWDTKNVTAMARTFSDTRIDNLQTLTNWDVSNVTTFYKMFEQNPNMIDASAINGWNIQPTATFSQMFKNTPTHPKFTKVPGTWHSNGTFTPTQ